MCYNVDMNQLNPFGSALQLFASFIGTIFLAVFIGVFSAFIHLYIGIALFLIIFIAGIAGSIKLYLMPQ